MSLLSPCKCSLSVYSPPLGRATFSSPSPDDSSHSKANNQIRQNSPSDRLVQNSSRRTAPLSPPINPHIRNAGVGKCLRAVLLSDWQVELSSERARERAHECAGVCAREIGEVIDVTHGQRWQVEFRQKERKRRHLVFIFVNAIIHQNPFRCKWV